VFPKPRPDKLVLALPDYRIFKLFHLSVFWRAAIAGRFKSDPRISFAPYDAQLQRMLLTGDIGDPVDLPLLIGILKLDELNRPVADVSALFKGEPPWEGHHLYLMAYAYCEWYLWLARPAPPWIADIEAKRRATGKFMLLVSADEDSKSGRLLQEELLGVRARGR